eukprot:TRINITY_DN17703_c0_g1_i1.p1 TRINITY_DN17703_c0_g1~~TRINITY_DN17703_c0_g1_i1.p1  ORF type:complete len:663 (+),score=347.88 TRINITY_DN17703_c0_g1_i1:38-1990(+)
MPEMEPYVFVQTLAGAAEGTVLKLTGPLSHHDKLADIPRQTATKSAALVYDTFSMVPFSTMRERCAGGSTLYQAHNEGEQIITMNIAESTVMKLDDFYGTFNAQEVSMDDAMTYDHSQQEYEEIIRAIISEEIGKGEGSSFVTPRKCMGNIKNFDDVTAKSIFRRLLLNEYGCYWKFLFCDGTGRYFIGASPERHLEIRNGKALMNPISGTFRKNHKLSNEQNIELLKKFLGDKKETQELFMVTDEELKMMSTMCGLGGKIIGPLLKEMSHLIHTEYLLEGTPNDGEDLIDLLRKSMFAPTVIGSPVGNACKVVAKYEKGTRSYYSSCALLIGREHNEEFLDSSITIRTLEIEKTGAFSIRVGATLVKDSVPNEEFQECEAKVRGALTSLQMDRQFTTYNCEQDKAVLDCLYARNANTSQFWMQDQHSFSAHPELAGKKVVMSNNEDDFIFMLRHLLFKMGCEVEVFNFFEIDTPKMQKAIAEADLCVVGPGPGDPTDTAREDSKMGLVRKYVKQLLDTKKPFMAVCLGHQVLSHHLGFEIVQKDVPTQGVQEKVNLYGEEFAVGFYNAFYARHNADKVAASPLTSVSTHNDDMLSTRGPHWTSFQFHPESILTVRGFDIVRDALLYVVRASAGKRPLNGANGTPNKKRA